MVNFSFTTERMIKQNPCKTDKSNQMFTVIVFVRVVRTLNLDVLFLEKPKREICLGCKILNLYWSIKMGKSCCAVLNDTYMGASNVDFSVLNFGWCSQTCE